MAPGRPPAHRLVLLRHAKSDWPEGVDDLERPLAGRGVADAAVAGRELAAIAVPDLVLCSPAHRTRQTWQLVQQALPSGPPPGPPDRTPVARLVPALYGASVPELIDLVRAIAPDVVTALVIGHEPTMSATARELAGPESEPGALALLHQDYPTSAMAVLRLEGDWTELAPAGATLERFLIPRA